MENNNYNIVMDMNKDRMYFLIFMIVVTGIILAVTTGVDEIIWNVVQDMVSENFSVLFSDSPVTSLI